LEKGEIQTGLQNHILGASLWKYGPTAFNGSVPVEQHKLRVTMTGCLIKGLATATAEEILSSSLSE